MSYTMYANGMELGVSLGVMDLCRWLAHRGMTDCPAARCLSTFNCETSGTVLAPHKVRAAANSMLLCTVQDVQAYIDHDTARTKKCWLASAVALDREGKHDQAANLRRGPFRTMGGTAWTWAEAVVRTAEWLLTAAEQGSKVEFCG